MKILLTDGTGLTSRQVATLAARAGHRVEVVAPTRLGPAGFTRWVRRIHRVPAYGADPLGWLEATLDVVERGAFDAVLPTQEQVAVLALHADRFGDVHLPVPSFASVLRVQDKAAQLRLLDEVGLPRPPSASSVGARPLYVKAPIGTASAGVRRVTTDAELAAARRAMGPDAVVQEAVDGPLVMVQSVFVHGELVAWHACERVREGVSGGAAVKRSVRLPTVAADLRALGAALDWHGALSLDAILTDAGPVYIDVNPRLVEPGNAAAAGVDLIGAMLPDVGVTTRQLLLSVLAAPTRRDVVRALRSRDGEELTPTAGDPRAAIPVVVAAALMLVAPSARRLLVEGAASSYALTPAAWQTLLDEHARLTA